MQGESRSSGRSLAQLGVATALLVATGSALLGCEPAVPMEPGARAMYQRLRDIGRDADPMQNIYANDARARALERKKTARGSGADFTRRFQLARERLRAGDSGQAIDDFTVLLEEANGLADARAQRGVLRGWLALAWLRQAEQENCLVTEGACLFPIGAAGVHKRKQSARNAIEQLELLLAEGGDAALARRSRWLLNIAYMSVGRYPDGVPEQWRIAPQTFASDIDVGQFTDIAPRLGVDVVGLSGGAIMEDFNGDGLLDLFMTSWGLLDQARLFVSRGDGGFRDATEASGLTGITGGLNVQQADYDNDGDVDILILRGGWTQGEWRQPNSLLRNDGGRFADVTEQAGLLDYLPSQTAVWGDFDNDGWLDLYVGNETMTNQPVRYPNQLFMNQRDGTFRDLAPAAGVDVTGFVKGVTAGDIDNDGRLDLYVSRLGAANVLLHNDGVRDGVPRFSDITQAAGVGQPVQSFPAWFWDFDNDGWQDIWVSGYGPSPRGGVAEVAADYLGEFTLAERPRLYRNRHDGTFAEVSRERGMTQVLYTMGSNFGDLDNDGWPDLYAATGDPDLRSLMPNRMLRNDAGMRFQDVTTSGGVGHLQKGHGVAFGDLDNDGDQDIFVVMGGAFSGDVFQNLLFENPGHGHRWVTLRLVGEHGNAGAIGARVRVTVGTSRGLRNVYVTAGSGGSFGANSLQQEIGLGEAQQLESVEVLWPGDVTAQRVTGVSLDRVWEIRQGVEAARAVELPLLKLGAGGNAAGTHRHHGD